MVIAESLYSLTGPLQDVLKKEPQLVTCHVYDNASPSTSEEFAADNSIEQHGFKRAPPEITATGAVFARLLLVVTELDATPTIPNGDGCVAQVVREIQLFPLSHPHPF